MVDEEQKKPTGPVFMVHNIYSKDVSFEAPNSPGIFSLPWDPKVDFDLGINTTKINEELWEVLLNITVKVATKIEEKHRAEYENKPEETAFLVEVKTAGLFTVTGYDKEHTNKILATTAPAILFPYTREAVSSMVNKGGFPQLILPPMNFDAMYQKHLAEQKQANNNNSQTTAE